MNLQPKFCFWNLYHCTFLCKWDEITDGLKDDQITRCPLSGRAWRSLSSRNTPNWPIFRRLRETYFVWRICLVIVFWVGRNNCEIKTLIIQFYCAKYPPSRQTFIYKTSFLLSSVSTVKDHSLQRCGNRVLFDFTTSFFVLVLYGRWYWTSLKWYPNKLSSWLSLSLNKTISFRRYFISLRLIQ